MNCRSVITRVGHFAIWTAFFAVLLLCAFQSMQLMRRPLFSPLYVDPVSESDESFMVARAKRARKNRLSRYFGSRNDRFMGYRRKLRKPSFAAVISAPRFEKKKIKNAFSEFDREKEERDIEELREAREREEEMDNQDFLAPSDSHRAPEPVVSPEWNYEQTQWTNPSQPMQAKRSGPMTAQASSMMTPPIAPPAGVNSMNMQMQGPMMPVQVPAMMTPSIAQPAIVNPMTMQMQLATSMQAQAAAMQMQATAVMMQAQANAAALQLQPQLVQQYAYSQPYMYQGYQGQGGYPMVQQSQAQPLPGSDPFFTQGTRDENKRTYFLTKLLPQLSSAGPESIQRILNLIDLEFEIIEHLIAGHTGQVIEQAVRERNSAVHQSSPFVDEAFKLIINLASSSAKRLSNGDMYNYVVRKSKKSDVVFSKSKEKKKYLNTMIEALEYYYRMIQGMQ